MAVEDNLHELANNISLENQEEDIVDPWNVQSKSETGVDYDKLIGTYMLFIL